ncbi:MAG: radical SAM protein [Chitinispirillaceae bacterium]|nr:radical SAM protein [Chitinispirillaceae bacterium]
MLNVCEIFKSIQGESYYAGTICSLVRLSGCNLRCRYCDTAYSWEQGEDVSIDKVTALVREHRTSQVEITGGEPLLQTDTPRLCQRFLDLNYTVLLETNGSLDISVIPSGVIRIVDIKCPSSGHDNCFLVKNYTHLRPADECKFVISDADDFSWALELVRRENLHETARITFSPNIKTLPPKDLAEWILSQNAPVRLGLQLHKVLWGETRGV